jgi:curved DNA-binding protein CbpA
MNSINYYEILNIPRNSSLKEIKKAYYKLSLLHHPDKDPNKSSSNKFLEIKNAYEFLSQNKLKYDEEISAQEKLDIFKKDIVDIIDSTKHYIDLQFLLTLSDEEIIAIPNDWILNAKTLCSFLKNNHSSPLFYNITSILKNFKFKHPPSPFPSPSPLLEKNTTNTEHDLMTEMDIYIDIHKLLVLNNQFTVIECPFTQRKSDLTINLNTYKQIFQNFGDWNETLNKYNDLCIFINIQNNTPFHILEDGYTLSYTSELTLYDSLYGTTLYIAYLDNSSYIKLNIKPFFIQRMQQKIVIEQYGLYNPSQNTNANLELHFQLQNIDNEKDNMRNIFGSHFSHQDHFKLSLDL